MSLSGAASKNQVLIAKCGGNAIRGCLIAVTFLCSVVLAVLAYKAEAESRMAHSLRFWTPKILHALHQEDLLSVELIVKSFETDAIRLINLKSRDGNDIFCHERGPKAIPSVFRSKIVVSHHGIEVATLHAWWDTWAILRAATMRPATLFTTFGFSFLTALSIFLPLRKYKATLRRSTEALRDWARAPHERVLQPCGDAVLDAIVALVQEGLDRELKAERALGEARTASERSAIFAQLAHDIRSPLAALGMLAENSTELDADSQMLLRGAVQRLQKMAEAFLQTRREATATEESCEVANPASCVAAAIAEKRVEYAKFSDITWTTDIEESVSSLRIRVGETTLGRVVSNLTNNAVEACDGSGNVAVSVTREGDHAVIRVADNGAGIAPGVLARLRIDPVSIGKANGNGLGLRYAKQVATEAAGCLSIDSVQGSGTTVELRFPLS